MRPLADRRDIPVPSVSGRKFYAFTSVRVWRGCFSLLAKNRIQLALGKCRLPFAADLDCLSAHVHNDVGT
jgi:hypothetical protein